MMSLLATGESSACRTTTEVLMTQLILGLTTVLSASWLASEYQSAWRYILPAAGATHEHPPLRAIALQNERPDDLKERVSYRGTQRRYAQIRYGSPGSIRVAVVLDQSSP